MRRASAWVVAIGILIGWAAWPAAARGANVWVTLAAGLPGSDIPTSQSEFRFDSPHAPPIVAVSELAGGFTAQAATAGGSTFFGGSGTPVLLNLSDGSAFLASGNPPDAAKTAGAGGGTPASAAPAGGGGIPSTAALLGVAVAEPDPGTGNRALTATITDANGKSLGSGNLTFPANGWWVLGLTPGADPLPDPGPIPDPITGTGGTDPSPQPTSSPPVNGSVATPEPATIALAAVGGLAVRVWRRARFPAAAGGSASWK